MLFDHQFFAPIHLQQEYTTRNPYKITLKSEYLAVQVQRRHPKCLWLWCWGIWVHPTCSMQRRPPSLALGTPDVRRNIQQVLHNLRVALPAGDVEGVPTILVPQCGISTVAQQLLDHTEAPPSAGHHQGSPERGKPTVRLQSHHKIAPSHSGSLSYWECAKQNIS